MRLTLLDDHLLIKLTANASEITLLDFSYQSIHDDDIERLCNALMTNTHVYSLLANATAITDRGVYKIMELLRRNQHLMHIELARNAGLTDACINAFLNEFKARFYNHNGYCRLALNPHRTLQSIEERSHLSPQQFITDYYVPQCPVIVRNAQANMPAVKKWTPEYLIAKVGEKKITLTIHDFRAKNVEHYYHRISNIKMKLKHAAYIFDNLAPQRELMQKYTVENAPMYFFPEIQNDLELPSFGRKTIEQNYLQRLWFGQKYTHTALHHDARNILFTQIYGEKQFLLYSPEDNHYLLQYHPRPNDLNSGTHVSRKHQSDVLDEFSKIFNLASGLQTNIYPGDVLFIPSGWWHEVRSRGTSTIAISTRIEPKKSAIPRLSELLTKEFCKKIAPNHIIMKYSKILLNLSSPNEFIYEHSTILQLAVLYHATPAVKLLLENPLTQPDVVSHLYPFTPLFLAIKYEYLDILDLLLAHHTTHLNRVFPFLGYTPLTLAAENGCQHAIKRLILAGADPLIPDKFGRLIF